MNLDELQSVRDRERQTDKLQQLRESFYADAGEFIGQLRSERERAAERAEDPFDAPEVNRLTDEINTAEQTVEAIYEKRVGKIVKAASFAAADLPAEVDGMTAEEQVLFDTMVEDIKGNRERVLDVLAGEESDGGSASGTADATDSTAADATEPDVRAADVMGADGTGDADDRPHEVPPATGGGPEPPPDDAAAGNRTTPSAAGSKAPDGNHPSGSETDSAGGEPLGDPGPPGDAAGEHPVRKDGGTESASGSTASERSAGSTAAGIERETVRITEDVGPFVGSDDRDYDLDRDDVVRLPATNAELLVEQDAAEQVD